MEYEIRRLKDNNIVLTYKYGYTEVQCNKNKERTIIINETGISHIEHQFNELFGKGEYKKFKKHIITHSKEKNTNNPHCVKHTLLGSYLPKKVLKDMKAEEENKDDLINKFFRKTK